MSDDEPDQHRRANRLRRQIERLKSAQKSSPAEEAPARKPGESPKEYVERRTRETSRKNPSQKSASRQGL